MSPSRLTASSRVSAKSALEEALARDLAFMAKREVDPWPMYEREVHPFWCCEHTKRQHGRYFAYSVMGCAQCYSPLDDLEEFAHEYDHGRNFRCDFIYPRERIAVEVDGLLFGAQGGAHQTGAGVLRDRDKDAALRLAGWDVIRVSPAQVKDGTALALIEKALGVKS